jgi:hypothetical protein
MGKRLREKCPRSSHAVWNAPANRPDPLRLLEQSNKGRLPELIPIRYGRMVRTRSPSTAGRRSTWRRTWRSRRQPACACRHARLPSAQLWRLATPERRVIFDINDLDETLPAPWEWDVKRLAASFVLPVAATVSVKTTRTMRRCPAFGRIANAWRNTARCRR